MSFHALTYLPNKNSAIVLFNIKAYIHLPKYSAIAKKEKTTINIAAVKDFDIKVFHVLKTDIYLLVLTSIK